jgi:hypothetical protein
MNALKFFRNSNLVACASMLMFVFSCTQYDINNAKNNFDYSAYNQYKNSNSKIYIDNDFNQMLSRSSIADRNQAILDDVNHEYGTNVVLPDEFLEFHLDMSSQEIQSKSLQLGYVNQQDITLVNSFYDNLIEDGFNSAMTSFENDVLALNPTNAEFEHYNKFANNLKSLNDEANLDSYTSRGMFWCLVALMSFALAATNLWLCGTPPNCLRAFIAYVLTCLNVAHSCEDV